MSAPGAFTESLGGKRVLVIGLARTGAASAQVAAEYGARVLLVDRGEPADSRVVRARLEAAGVEVRTNLDDLSVIDDVDLVIPSPGVSVHTPLLREAISRGKTCISEIEFAVRSFPHSRLIAVTGTNGKTTVTELIAHLIQSDGGRATVGGNIGIPLIEVLASASEDVWVVAEVSSFQLALASSFAPAVAVFLNFEDDHLDWHATLDEYFEAKASLVRRLSSQSDAVLQWADPRISGLATESSARINFFAAMNGEHATLAESFLRTAERDDTVSFLRFDGRTIRGVVDKAQVEVKIKDFKLVGEHNYENAAAAALAAIRAGVSANSLREGFPGYVAAAHRMKPIADICGVTYYDDSKATNPHAAKAAIKTFAQPVIVLLGGRNKGNDLAALARFAGQHTKAAVCFGESGPELYRHLSKEKARLCRSLEEAVLAAHELAGPGDVVLLSPGCASFDAFSSYSERGDAFKRSVLSLAGNTGGGGID